MKNISKLFGIIATIALIGFAFLACDDSLGGLPPGPAAPAFTNDVTGVTTEQAAKDILQKFVDSEALNAVIEEARTVIDDNTDKDADEWDIKDKESKSGASVKVVVNASSKQTIKGSESLTKENGPKPKVGDYVTLSEQQKRAITLKDTMTAGTDPDKITFVKGSSYVEDSSVALTLRVTSLAEGNEKMSFTASGESLIQAGFTIQNGTSGIRVELNCSLTLSLPPIEVGGDEGFELLESGGADQNNLTYNGYLKVYGAGDAPLIDMNISDAESYGKALALLGMDISGDDGP